MYKKNILIVDDNKNTLEIIRRNLAKQNYKTICVSNVQNAITALNQNDIELVITDNKMPQTTGLEFIGYLKDHYPKIKIIMITGYASIDNAVEAMKTGAHEYLPKPFTDIDLMNVVRKMIKRIENADIEETSPDDLKWREYGIIGKSKQIHDVFNLIEKASLNSATVLITGESGTGKELVARAIHYLHHSRATWPFIPVNCPGIPEQLFESELFGHVKGAFTGATEKKAGLFSSADKGTLFLDEITELNFHMQSKLLRVLQEKTVSKVGSSLSENVDVRIIAASNKNLEELVKKEVFRNDLFYRINVFNIHIPPLRERAEDILPIANYFITKYSKIFNRMKPTLSEPAAQALLKYSWPGNVRELENTIQHVLIVNETGVIDCSELPEKMKFNISFSVDTNLTLKEAEKKHITAVLESVNGNKSKAAEILAIDRKTLREKLK